MPPTVRRHVFDTYWRFAAERQRIFALRAEAHPGPWTDDPILRRFKFCNTFRASDRVSQYLISRVIYSADARDLPPEDVFLRIVLFRLFSKESTWEALEQATGGVRRETLDVERLGVLLDDLRQRQPIYTAAFILAAHDAYGHRIKHRNHLELVKRMFAPGGLGADLGAARTLEGMYDALRAWPMIGPFMGYQLAIDLNYSEHFAFDEDEFTVPGPGAARGLRKVFTDFGGETPQQLIMRMVDTQEEEFARLQLPWVGLFGRRLHAIDCQGLFCETDKYSRAAFPELQSERVRIKQEFRVPKPSLELFYPPKWAINGRLPASPSTPARSVGATQLTLSYAEPNLSHGNACARLDGGSVRPVPFTLLDDRAAAAD
jgi:hypothetical protein